MLTTAITTAEMLGGRRTLKVNIESDRDLIQAVNKGLPVEALNELIERLFPKQKSRRYQIVPRSTLVRKEKQNLSLGFDESQKVERIARTFGFAVEVWDGNINQARRFMEKSHPMLGGQTPFEASLTELGAREVEQILGRLKYGVGC